jgi:hypothetical protein
MIALPKGSQLRNLLVHHRRIRASCGRGQLRDTQLHVHGPHLFFFFLVLLSNSATLSSRVTACAFSQESSSPVAFLQVLLLPMVGFRRPRRLPALLRPRHRTPRSHLGAIASCSHLGRPPPRHGSSPPRPVASYSRAPQPRRPPSRIYLVLRRSPWDPLFFAETSASSPLPPVAPTDGGWLPVPAVGFAAVRHRDSRTELGQGASSDATLLGAAAFGASKEGRQQTIYVVAARSTRRSCQQWAGMPPMLPGVSEGATKARRCCYVWHTTSLLC